MGKHYPRLPLQVIVEHDVMSDEEIRELASGESMGESGDKGKVMEDSEANASPTPPTPCQSDSPKNPTANSVPDHALPPTRKQIDRMIGDDYTLMLHFLTRKAREDMEQGKLPTDEQRACIRLFDDLKRSYDYTQKFAEHIKQNPSALIRPGSMGGQGTQQVRNLESQLRKSTKKDGRKSSTPPAPPPDAGFSLPA